MAIASILSAQDLYRLLSIRFKIGGASEENRCRYML